MSQSKIIYKEEREVVASDYWCEDLPRKIITYVEAITERKWSWFRRKTVVSYVIGQHVPYVSRTQLMGQDEACNSYLRGIAAEEWMKAELFKKEYDLQKHEVVDVGGTL